VNYVNEDPNVLTSSVSADLPTVYHAFKKSVAKHQYKNFLGKRDDKKEGRPYQWMSWVEADEYVTALAKGLKSFNMMPDVDVSGKKWNFLGIYAKNRPEWVLCDLASTALNGTTIAFYDTLGPQAIEFVINQT
jgi:long-chain acyl-CoA synthetase